MSTNAISFGPRLGYETWEPINPPKESIESFYFEIDSQLIYLSFYKDSGPLNAACLYRFCLHLHTLLDDIKLKEKKIILYSSSEPDKKANAVLLLALYAMIVMRWSPGDVLHPLSTLELQPFRDAGYARADYHLSHQSIIYGISKAISEQLLDLSTFDLTYYENYEKVENGDWNWLTPGFVAFASPVEPSYIASLAVGGGAENKIEGARPRLSKAFRNVLTEFEKAKVKVVVRLNKQLYDAEHFKEIGIDHVEMYFDDGTNPTLEMTRDFIQLSDRIISAGGSLAVHCKAGLGRTGTLIGAYLIYKHGFTASEAIGFMRLMRPGSCVGPQQHFLYENQMTWVKWAAVDAHIKATTTSLPIPVKTSTLSERSTTPPPKSMEEEPITPPNEATLAITRSRNTTPVPSTSTLPPPLTGGVEIPKTPSRKIIVPGQPRKTPGKSKHSVASPEIREVDIVPMAPLVDLIDSEMKDEILEDPITVAISSVRPTRIAKVTNKVRSRSAITDNRFIDLINPLKENLEDSSTTEIIKSNKKFEIGEFTRSKTVKKGLTTLFEDFTSPATTKSVERYELRKPLPITTTTAATAISIAPPASPSKLPRMTTRKRTSAKIDEISPSTTTTDNVPTSTILTRSGSSGSFLSEGNSNEILAKNGKSGNLRSVRRRRSSLGSTDFVQPTN